MWNNNDVFFSTEMAKRVIKQTVLYVINQSMWMNGWLVFLMQIVLYTLVSGDIAEWPYNETKDGTCFKSFLQWCKCMPIITAYKAIVQQRQSYLIIDLVPERLTDCSNFSVSRQLLLFNNSINKHNVCLFFDSVISSYLRSRNIWHIHD